MSIHKKFYEVLSKILDLDLHDINENLVLSENIWDSLGILSTAAAIDEIYSKEIQGEKLTNSKNLEDLINLIENN